MTKSGIPVNQRDVWLVPIPFSDLRSQKRRPVVVLSNRYYHSRQEDCLVMAITSQVDSSDPLGIILNGSDLDDGTLPKQSQIRVDKVFSIHRRIMIHYFGRLCRKKYEETITVLNQLIKFE